MRIAVTGTHRVGKSTLIEALEERLAEYRVVDEPYLLLEEEGYAFASPPSLDDFLTHEESEVFDLEEWLARIRSSLQTLDLLVFVPIEERDRIQLPVHEAPQLRVAVDEKLAWMLLDDPFEWGVEVLPVHGSTSARVTQVLERLGRG